MKSFEDELSELLDARADRVDARPDDAFLTSGGSASDSCAPDDLATDTVVVLESVGAGGRMPRNAAGQERGPRQWLLGAAAAMVLVLGVFGLTRGSDDSVVEIATADQAADAFLASVASGAEFIVWLEPDAPQEQIDAVGDSINASALVDSARYVSLDETLAEFEKYWQDSPEILAAVKPEQLPTSFRVTLRAGADPERVASFIRGIEGLPGVRSVLANEDLDGLANNEQALDLGTPLFVLPPEGFSTAPVVGNGPLTNETAIESMIVGRRTDSGVTDLLTIDWAFERGFTTTTTLKADGRHFELSDEHEGLMAERQADGTWLRFNGWRDPALTEQVAPATTVAEGRLNFSDEASGLEVLTTSTPGPHAQTTTVVFGNDGPELNVTIAAVGTYALPLFRAAANEGPIEFFSNDEIDGYFLRSDNPLANDMTIFSWQISDNHVATIEMPGSDDEVLETVAGLRIVDEATWRARIESDAAAGEAGLLEPADGVGLIDEYLAEPPVLDGRAKVWIASGASDEAVTSIRDASEALGGTVTIVPRAQAANDFEHWAGDRPGAALAGSEALPDLMLVDGADPLLVSYNLRTMSGVDRVVLSPSLSTAPLFLLPAGPLPPDASSLDELDGFLSEEEPGADSARGSLMVVGRPTTTGFDRLMGVTLLTEREYEGGNARMIDGREVFVSAEEEGVAVEFVGDELTDGGDRWLHFSVNDIDTELEALVRATSVVDGVIQFQPYDGVIELDRVSDALPPGRQVSVGEGIGGDEGFSVTTMPTSASLGLFVVATSVEEVTTVEVRGQVGYRAIVSVEFSEQDLVAWHEPSGHMVYVATSGPGGAIELAESLAAVDETTWRDVVSVPDPLF